MQLRVFSKALKVGLKDNTSAFGYSVTVTGSYAVLTSLKKNPSLGELFAGAAGAVCAFIVIEAATLLILRNMEGGEPERTRLIARLMNVVSVGTSMGAAALCGYFLGDMLAWFVGVFSATCLFVLLDAVELSIVKDERDQEK